MTNAPSGVALLSMFAGTNWDKMSVAAYAKSGAWAGRACGRASHARAVLSASIFLGGVPRLCTQYAEECRRWHVDTLINKAVGDMQTNYEYIFKSNFAEFFGGVHVSS